MSCWLHVGSQTLPRWVSRLEVAPAPPRFCEAARDVDGRGDRPFTRRRVRPTFEARRISETE
eukprot:6464455-Pyramimonas_sp.AAC.1